MDHKPLIMLTNDDGIASPGLLALIQSLHTLGELLIVAPRHQQSAMSRSYMQNVGVTETHIVSAGGADVLAYSVEASPAQAVRHGLLRFAARRPDLLIAGINYGENVGASVTISGTVGAAWEGASTGVPAIAISLEVDVEHHFAHSEQVDFSTAAVFARQFAESVIRHGLAPGVDIININIPENATPDTPWRITRVSRFMHFHDIVEHNELGEKVIAGYHRKLDLSKVEPDSDLYVLFKEQQVAVTPLTIDTTAHADFADVRRRLSER